MDYDKSNWDRGQPEKGPLRKPPAMWRLLAVANIIFHDIAFGLGYHSSVLRLSILLFLIVVIVPDQEGVVIRNAKAREHSRFGLVRPGVHDLDNLTETDRFSIDPSKAPQNRSHANGREYNPED